MALIPSNLFHSLGWGHLPPQRLAPVPEKKLHVPSLHGAAPHAAHYLLVENAHPSKLTPERLFFDTLLNPRLPSAVSDQLCFGSAVISVWCLLLVNVLIEN